MRDNHLFNPNQSLKERYQLQRQLGNNAGRQTWLAHDLQSGEQVTVKLLAFNPQMEWDEFKLFEREAAVLKQLNHPRIPKYRDYFSLDQQIGAGLCWFGLVQDYIPGKSLQQLLNEGKRFTESQVRSFAKQVLEILAYLHGLNSPVLHRDIKPSNLILGNDKQVYLVDFGAVQNSAAVEGVTFTVVGTSGYAPLEQFWGQAVPASDLYALGATLIHLLTGIPPADLPQRNLRIQFRNQVSINSQLISWIEALTEPDLGLRLSCANQALDALETGRSIPYPLETIQPLFLTQIQIHKSPKEIIVKIPQNRLLFGLILMETGLKYALFVSLFFVWVLLILLLVSAAGGVVIATIAVIMVMILEQIPLITVRVFLGLAFISGIIFFVSSYLVSLAHQKIGKYLQDIKKISITNFLGYSLKINPHNFVIGYLYFRGNTSDIKDVFIGNKGCAIYLETRINNSYSSKRLGQSVYWQAGVKTYCLANYLTQSEANWLRQEIQDWLADYA